MHAKEVRMLPSSVEGAFVSYELNVSEANVNLALQYINQKSIGNADTNLAQAVSVTGGKKISVNAFGLKASTKISDASFLVAYTKVLKDNAKHDSVVLPWDGTPLFTDMITSNDLFQSLYGNALKADGNYIGGSQYGKSEHTVEGKRYDLVAHMVHQNKFTKQLAVIAVFFEEGNERSVQELHDRVIESR